MTRFHKLFSLILLLSLIVSTTQAAELDKLSFSVSIDKLTTDLTVFSAFALPGDTLDLSVTGSGSGQFVKQYAQGRLIENNRTSWRYVVPEQPGHYTLTILHNDPPEKFVLNVFVLVPASQVDDGKLNGYRIGSYPEKPFRGNPEYRQPEGFIEVTENMLNTHLTPHFKLGQFLCKQQPDHWPKYVVLKPKLLIKLELLLDRLVEKGIEASTVFIMSGYRTPWYNAAIGNGRYSRHIYGDAADTYIDENHDAEIDDLNKDGKASMADADVIYNIIDKLDSDPDYKHLIGGLGKYNKTAAHTWDVHVDTRGYKARW